MQYSYSATDNRLTQTTLASGNTIAYGYDNAGRVISQNATVGGTTTSTYTTDGAIDTVQNSNGQIKYTYDVNGALSGIDDPNGSSIRYERDLLGRVTKITEKATPTATGAVTQYTYDAVGNLKTVIDPIGGVTTMTYDAANQLTQRRLPNGITTSYTYNLVDQVVSIVHKAADGTVLASMTYERGKGGEPTKITREDGSYTDLTYDGALRVTKEAYYDGASVLQETITYTYDASGKRTAKTDGQGNHAYNYASGFRLSTVQDANETEQYTYDADGRLSQVNRDGSAISLSHDDYDRLTSINNATTGQNVVYLYDAQGRRIGENDGTTKRRYLVDPSMGSGLDVQDLVTDGSGNVLANYIYAGSAPLMRLDANGNPVYYLTDGMGSVIGLANNAGQSVAKYSYDGFGNIRNSSGSDSAASILGGDFRFQGQWLESESGLYYMRARDYDSNTGRFISRDPVDLIQTEPESFDPYQFVYDNPYVFTDPTGAFTITEINTTQKIQDILNSYIRDEAVQFLKETTGRIFSNIALDVINQLLPGTAVGEDINNLMKINNDTGTFFQNFIEDNLCPLLPDKFSERFWFGPQINTEGRVLSPGYKCGGREKYTKPKGELYIGVPDPDFLFEEGDPTKNRKYNPKSFLVGDVKITADAVIDDIKNNDNQWLSIFHHAKTYQSLHLAAYITFKANKIHVKEEIEKIGIQKGIILYVVTIFN